MLNRAVVQPDPAVALGLAADTMAAAADAESLDEVFLRLEAAGVMLRIDSDVVPTMAKAPTLGVWELDLLRPIKNVVRLGHIKYVAAGEIVLDDGVVPLAPGSLVVHCAASGLQYPPLVPLWGPDKIRLQTIRAGFPCFGAALAGFVEATRDEGRERNRLCPPNTLPDNLTSWARMQVRGTLATCRAPTALSQISRTGPTAAPSTPRVPDRPNVTNRRCAPLPRVWLSSPIKGSHGWPNLPASRCQVSTEGSCCAPHVGGPRPRRTPSPRRQPSNPGARPVRPLRNMKP
jgi:hypothetical protein